MIDKVEGADNNKNKVCATYYLLTTKTYFDTKSNINIHTQWEIIHSLHFQSYSTNRS